MILKTIKKIAPVTIKYLIAFAIIFYLLKSDKIDHESLSIIFQNKLLFLQVIFVLIIISILGTLKWFVLLRSQKINVTFSRCFTMSYIGHTFNYFLPGGIAGDIVKSGYMIKEKKARSNSVLSILIDRVMGLFSMMIVVALLLPFFLNQILDNDLKLLNNYYFVAFYILLILALAATVLGIFFYVLRHKALYKKILSFFYKRKNKSRIYEIILSVIKALFLYRNSAITIIQNIFIAATIQIIIGYCLFLIGNSLISTDSTTLFSNIISSIITQLISIIPISPGGIGIGEVAFAKTMYYLNNQTLLSYATIYLIYRIYNILFGIPAIALFLFRKSKRKN